MGGPRIQWDEDKAEANRRKHGVDFFEATEVLLDPLAVTIGDRRPTTPTERRVTIIGMSRRGWLHVRQGRLVSPVRHTRLATTC
jgi:uncharacterized DUF497 family protein